MDVERSARGPQVVLEWLACAAFVSLLTALSFGLMREIINLKRVKNDTRRVMRT